MAIDAKTLAASKKYTKETVEGAGAIKGKNCTVDSITSITGGHRVTFKWTLDSGTVLTDTMDVMDGNDGVGIASVDIDSNNHLIITYDNGGTHDAGELPGAPSTQVTTLPLPSATEVGKVYQYIGASDSNYTHGFFYECVLDGSNYIWENVKVQSGGGTGVDNFKDLEDVSFGTLTDGDLPQYDSETGKWKNSQQSPLDIQHLQGSMGTVKLGIEHLSGSMANLNVAIHNLDLLVASKVDKEAGKGLSTNDFTDTLKDKLVDLEPIYLIGSGLNLDPSTGKLSATGVDVPIDTIAIPIEALQGSMANKVDKEAGKGLSTEDFSTLNKQALEQTIPLNIQQLQASLLTKANQSTTYTKTEVDNLIADITTMNFEVVPVLPTTDISKTTIYLVPKGTPGSQNIYGEWICLDDTTTPVTWELIGDTQIDLSNYIQKSSTSGLVKNDGSIDAQIQLDVSQLQGSVLNIKLDVNQLSASMINKADKSELDEWSAEGYVDSTNKVAFDNLDDTLGYKLCGWDRLVRINSMRKDTGTNPGTIKLTFSVDAPQNTKCILRIMK